MGPRRGRTACYRRRDGGDGGCLATVASALGLDAKPPAVAPAHLGGTPHISPIIIDIHHDTTSNGVELALCFPLLDKLVTLACVTSPPANHDQWCCFTARRALCSGNRKLTDGNFGRILDCFLQVS
jgi:hypothetical protein